MLSSATLRVADPRRTPLTVGRDLKVRTKLLASFTFVSLLLVVLGAVSLTKLSDSKTRLRHMYSHSLQSVSQIDAINAGVLTIAIDLRDIVIDAKETDITAAEATLAGDDKNLDTAVAAYAQAQNPAAFAEIRTDLASYRSARAYAHSATLSFGRSQPKNLRRQPSRFRWR